MRERLRRILDPETPLRDRLFQLLSTIALGEYVLVSLYTILFSGDPGHIALMLAGTGAFAATVTFTFRSGHMRLGATVSGLLYFLMYPLTFFSSGGMYGGAPVVFAFALVYVFLVTERWERVASLALCVAGSAACYVISYLRPETLERHTVLAEHAESFLAILLVTLLLCALFAFVTGVYSAENRVVQRQKKEIEELNRAQKRFFSSMSHEIRTPVNAIIGLNEMNLREALPREVRENAQNIEVAGKTLLHTVNELLDMSRLESGLLEILPGDYRTTAMLSDVVSMVWLQAQEKGLEFTVRADPALPAALRGDEMRVKQVLLNVVNNAVKYTQAGSVELSISGRREGGGFRAVFEVADTGIGIRPENIPDLFNAFRRVDAGKTHSIEGTGLGLAIVKELLDLMGGSVRVESEYGKGSTFHIEIPQEIAEETPIGEVSLGRQGGKSAAKGDPGTLAVPGIRILAVDDTPMNLMVVRKLLRDTGAAVDTAASGAEALQKTLETRYDVILMDHQMPEMDGIECLHRIRAQEGGLCRESRAVCLTANAGGDVERLCREAGFDGYLVKPVRGKVLEAEVARLVKDGKGD